MAKRPGHKELTGKLRQAREALDNGRFLIIEEDRHFTHDIAALESQGAKDHWSKVVAFLGEIQASGGADCYVGKYPPAACYHEPYQGVELFAFAWDSALAECRMYLKFGIKISKKSKEPTYLYLNCHEDKPGKKDR